MTPLLNQRWRDGFARDTEDSPKSLFFIILGALKSRDWSFVTMFSLGRSPTQLHHSWF
jgi:hypothetical protein